MTHKDFTTRLGAKARGVSTAPVVLAVIVVAMAMAFYAYQWWYSQTKAAELASQWAQRLAEEKALCLTAYTDGQFVYVGGARLKNYTGLNCYVDPSVVVIVEVNKTYTP